MKTLFLLLLPLAVALGVPAHANEQDADALKRATARAVGQLQGKTLQVDSSGNVVRDAHGNAQTAPVSVESLQSGLKYFQATTGLQGVSPQSVASDGGGVSAVKVNQTYDFRCAATFAADSRFSLGGLTFRPLSCTLNAAGAVVNVNFRVCDAGLRASTCAAASDFTASLTVAQGAYSSQSGMHVGLGCNSAGQCRLTVVGEQRVGTSGGALTTRAAQLAGQSDVVGGLRDMTSSAGYTQKMAEIGAPLAQCAELNAQGAETGRFVTCDGRNAVSVLSGGQATGAACQGSVARCVQESVSQRTSTRSCVRTFPMTERSYLRSYPSQETCVLRDFLADKKGVDKFGTDSNSCVQPSGAGRLAGMTKVGDTPWVCVQTGVLNEPEPLNIEFYDKDGKLLQKPYPQPFPEVFDKDGKPITKTHEDPVEECVARERTEYFMNLTNFQTISQTDYPSAVGGACDENPLSESRLEQCEGPWFGRTLPDNQCSVLYRMSDTETISGGLNFMAQWGCGFCTKPKVRQTCRAVPAPTQEQLDAGADDEDNCASLELSGCSMTSATALTYSGGDSGLATSQRETYTCLKEERQCTRWTSENSDPTCINKDMAQGLDTIQSGYGDSGSFNNAMVAAAMLDGVAQGVEGKHASEQVPLIFGGTNNRCSYPTGAIGSLITRNCCRQNLFRPKKGVLFQAGCGMAEAKLAAARRSRYAVYIGEYCSRRLPRPFRTCIRRTQSYCVFQGILPRLVHEQGRQQLAQMVGSSAQAQVQKAPLNFSYYDTGNGRWTPAVTVNGVQLRAWQWPKHCANLSDAAQTLLEQPDANTCPAAVTTYFAACDKQGGCDALIDAPEYGSLDWSLRAADGLKNQTSAVSRFSVVTGACSPTTGQCAYEAAAWPAGVGGRAVVTKDLNWPLYQPQAIGPSGQALPADYRANNVGDLMFRMYPNTGVAGSALPATVRLGFSRDGGQTWADAQLPTQTLRATEGNLGGSDIKITGGCSSESNSCDFRVTGTVTVTAKPWGPPEGPDCSGFTAGQLAALDFSKMDLTEWLDTVLDKVAGNSANPKALAASANERFQRFNEVYQGGGVKGSAPIAANFSRVVPAEGFGPFSVRLAVSGYWPEVSDVAANNTERVTRVEVDWGDCSARQVLDPVPSTEGVGFRGTHTYKAPDHDAHVCLKTGPSDSLERNIVHRLRLFVTTREGSTVRSYTRELSVENAWAKFPGANSNNDYVEESRTVSPYGAGSAGAPAQLPGKR